MKPPPPRAIPAPRCARAGVGPSAMLATSASETAQRVTALITAMPPPLEMARVCTHAGARSSARRATGSASRHETGTLAVDDIHDGRGASRVIRKPVVQLAPPLD